MSRPSGPSVRPLSLTEELEKLEQSITLTLQEIDHNFSRAHRIVSSSILPIVEQYAEHSSAVWEGSKFWKQFFEASANVSLSGVEEREEDEDFSYAQSHDNTSTFAASTQQGDDTLQTGSEAQDVYNQTDDSLLDNADISGSTPRAPQFRDPTILNPSFADYPSPYETLKQELNGDDSTQDGEDDTQIPPTTPGAQPRIPDMSMTPASSSFDANYLPSTTRSQRNQGESQLLHRVLDKNYRLQATPHSTRKENKTPANKPSWRDATPGSSPVAAPQLHADIFSSPIRQQYNAPRTPGVSVQTPAEGKAKEAALKPTKKDEISWESDSDHDAEDVYRELGMSPPKTIQFSLPQSRLLQTPAREASKRIVEDLLNTAGAAFDDTDQSPSVVAMKQDLDDSF